MKISIITVCFNSAATIDKTLHSVTTQSYDNIEYIVVDGKSTDATLELVSHYGDLVSLCISEPDRGIYDAFNKGLSLATGDVIGFINSDDFYPNSNVVATIAEAFTKELDLDAIYGDLCYVGQIETERVMRYWQTSDFKPGMFNRGWVPPHPTFFARRQVYERFGGFDLKYRIAADWELLARLIEVNRIKTRYLPQVLVHMRLGGMSNRSWSNVWSQNKEIWGAMKAHQLNPSLPTFFLGKLLSRSRQFLSRHS